MISSALDNEVALRTSVVVNRNRAGIVNRENVSFLEGLTATTISYTGLIPNQTHGGLLQVFPIFAPRAGRLHCLRDDGLLIYPF